MIRKLRDQERLPDLRRTGKDIRARAKQGFYDRRLAVITDLIQLCQGQGIQLIRSARFRAPLLLFFKGIFCAPGAVRSALKPAAFSAYMMEKLGYKNVSPKYDEPRTDIIQTVELGSKEALVRFAQGIQESSPIDSFVRVMPAPMPGYPFDEVMACGTFTQGSTIELSADAPVVPPYTLYLQGGLSLEYGKLSVLLALTKILR